MVVIGVMRIENESKQVTNTLRLLGVELRERFFTVIYFLRVSSRKLQIVEFGRWTEKAAKAFSMSDKINME